MDQILFLFKKTYEFLEFFEQLDFAILNSSKNVKIT